jgi:GTPase
MSYSIAIVGRPNVGKSTLFNRFTHTRNAIVGDTPGLTRDRQYGIMIINDEQNIIIIDTGGIGEAKTNVEVLMEKQARQATKEADLILFLVDARSGLTTADEVFARELRKLNKIIILVINKAEDQNPEDITADFYALGLEKPIIISAEHNIGISYLKEIIISKLPEPETIIAPLIEQNSIKIAFIGRPNVGKSTLVNRILGEERVIVYDEPGTTRDSIFINFNRRGKDYVLIDTAGVRRRGRIKEKIEKFSVIKSLQAIAASNVVVFVIDATENITDQDLKLLGFTIDAGKALVIAVNKWDNLPSLQRDKIKNELDRRLTFINFAEILFISALHGTGVGDIFNAVNKAYSSATKVFKTTQLTKILEKAITNFQPPLAHGQEIKMRLAHAGGHNPPTIIIHGTRTEYLPESYRRYLEHFFCKALELSGTPIQIVFKI